MTELDLYYTRRLDLEQALAGAALLDPACADLLLAEVPLREVVCSVSQAVLAALRSVRDEKPIRYAMEPALDLVLEELTMTGELARLEELGGRDAVRGLIEDRPDLRRALASLRAALDAMAPLSEEPVVLLAAEELGADQGYDGNLDPFVASRDSLPSRSVEPFRDSLPSRPVPSCRHRPPSSRRHPVSDERLREAERRWKETGSVDDEARYLLERVRVGGHASLGRLAWLARQQ